jgi:alanyl-tRNA synthetase
VGRSVEGWAGTRGLILVCTSFYRSSGGQPHDLGTLGGAVVRDVTEHDGEVVHWVARAPAAQAVHGQIDWQRRFDYMQQHTGQHILSQAFLELLNARTVSFHLGQEACTIDLDRVILDPAALERVEDRANQIIFEDRAVTARIVDPEDVPTLGLRKAPTVSSNIRIIEVEGFDRSPCGGTHCARSGEVGTIALRKVERRGEETRVEFVCGWRALHDHRWKTSTINELGLGFSVKDREVGAAVQRLITDATENRRDLQQLRSEMLPAEAQRLLASARPWREMRVVVQSFAEREVQELRRLATLLTSASGVIALLGTNGQQGRLVFVRSRDVAADMAALLSKTCQSLGGKGGGQSDQAQGGGFPGERVAEALELAYRTLTEQ